MQGGDYGRYTEVKIEKDLISRTAYALVGYEVAPKIGH